ncbi:MAG: ATP-binding cassette domain-containing protein [Pseudomonadota bacterium]
MQIRFDKVSKHYNQQHQALSEISFCIHQGEMVFLTGHSGAGKTTLLKLIALLERNYQGRIFLNGENIAKLKPQHIPYLRRHIGLIFQDPHLLPDRNVFHNVALPLVITATDKREIAKRVRAALDKVGLINKEKKYPQALSSGEQQRVGIARAIVSKPLLLLADEPTGNLDPALSVEIMDVFNSLNRG